MNPPDLTIQPDLIFNIDDIKSKYYTIFTNPHLSTCLGFGRQLLNSRACSCLRMLPSGIEPERHSSSRRAAIVHGCHLDTNGPCWRVRTPAAGPGAWDLDGFDQFLFLSLCQKCSLPS